MRIGLTGDFRYAAQFHKRLERPAGMEAAGPGGFCPAKGSDQRIGDDRCLRAKPNSVWQDPAKRKAK